MHRIYSKFPSLRKGSNFRLGTKPTPQDGLPIVRFWGEAEVRDRVA